MADTQYQIPPTDAQIEIADVISRIYVAPVHERLQEKPCTTIIHQSIVHGITRNFDVSHPVLAGAAFGLSYARTILIRDDVEHAIEVSIEHIKDEMTCRRNRFIRRVAHELSYITLRPTYFGHLFRWLGILLPKRKTLIEELYDDIVVLIAQWG